MGDIVRAKRRSVLTAMIGAALHGSLIDNALGACPQTTDKLHTAVRYAQEIIRRQETGASIQEISLDVNKLLGFLEDNFGYTDDEPDPAWVNLVLDSPEFSSLEDLQGIAENIVPVAIMRELISKHRIAFHLDKVPNFTPFVVRYGPAILGVSRMAVVEGLGHTSSA